MSDQPRSGATHPDGGAGPIGSVPPWHQPSPEGAAPEMSADERVFGSMEPMSGSLELQSLVVAAAPKEPPPGRRDPVAVAALVCGVVALAPFAIVLGVIALVRTKRPGVTGRTLAMTGIALGVLWSVGFVAVLGVAVLLGHRLTDSVGDLSAPNGTGLLSEVDGTTMAASEVQQGDCLAGWDPAGADGSDPDVVVVDCTVPHRAQAFGQIDLSDDYPEKASYPGAPALTESGRSACQTRAKSAVDPDQADGLEVTSIAPTAQNWADGSRRVTCLVVSADRDLAASVIL